MSLRVESLAAKEGGLASLALGMNGPESAVTSPLGADAKGTPLHAPRIPVLARTTGHLSTSPAFALHLPSKCPVSPELSLLSDHTCRSAFSELIRSQGTNRHPGLQLPLLPPGVCPPPNPVTSGDPSLHTLQGLPRIEIKAPATASGPCKRSPQRLFRPHL